VVDSSYWRQCDAAVENCHQDTQSVVVVSVRLDLLSHQSKLGTYFLQVAAAE
jgi:hypothetical protein